MQIGFERGTTAMFVPAHAAASESIAGLAQSNIGKVLEAADKITKICREPLCFEAILQRLFADYSLTMNFEQENICQGGFHPKDEIPPLNKNL